jgi:hypothetical protein
MARPDHFNFQRYLEAKKSVDDRSLNRGVWERLRAELPEQEKNNPLEILEIGAGIGTMFERLVEWGLLTYVQYTAIDLDPENIRSAERYLLDWGKRLNWRVSQEDQRLTFTRDARWLELNLQTISLDDFIEKSLPTKSRWDLLVAHAFLDLIDLPKKLPDLLSLLREGGLYYFTINFDGVTILEPIIKPDLDMQVVSLYHRSMDERSLGGHLHGDSMTGRHLFSYLEGPSSEFLAAGASDWVVHPSAGRYPADEGYFLDYIIHTIHQQLIDHPELDREEFLEWIEKRHDQVDQGELVFIAHQLDFLGRKKSRQAKSGL